jgi:hypothetical protein
MFGRNESYSLRVALRVGEGEVRRTHVNEYLNQNPDIIQ